MLEFSEEGAPLLEVMLALNVTLDCLALVDWIWVSPPLRRDPQLQNHNDLSDTPRRLSIINGDRQSDIIAIPGIRQTASPQAV